MGLQNISKTLLSRTVSSTADETGTAFRVDPKAAAVAASFSALFHITITDGTSPTCDAYVEGSSDNSNWVTLASMTQLTSGSRNERQAISFMPAYVRARIDVGGTAAPGWTGMIYLTSDVEFVLSA